MDGSIELKSKAGVGTTVIVKIPFKIGTQDKNSNLSDKLVSLDDYSVEGMRALVVEDNVLNMEISRCILEICYPSSIEERDAHRGRPFLQAPVSSVLW